MAFRRSDVADGRAVVGLGCSRTGAPCGSGACLTSSSGHVGASCHPGQMTIGNGRQQPSPPAVYLDQWVWIRFARVMRGDPALPGDGRVLDAVRSAADSGVAFPLSATHYEETLRITDPRQRLDLARVMAPVSRMQTLRRQSDLVRHQLLVAMHETLGRPAFRPAPVRVLGRGVAWAFQGVIAQLRVVDPEGKIQDADPAWLRAASQYFEAQALAGPPDDAVEGLRQVGYVAPRELEERPGNRLAWEQAFAERVADESPSRAELRHWLLGRELIHEYLDMLTRILVDYRLTFASIAGGGAGKSSTRRAVAFAERVPTLRIAVDMKLEVFRNRARTWNYNMVRDIDAISLALPYCRAVVADRDAVDLARRSEAPRQYGTAMLHDLAALPEVLDDLVTEASSSGHDPWVDPWNDVGPGVGFHVGSLARLRATHLAEGSAVRFFGPEGSLHPPASSRTASGTTGLAVDSG